MDRSRQHAADGEPTRSSSTQRIERILEGMTTYVDDLGNAEAAHMAIRRSQVAHAGLVEVDTSDAAADRDVHMVVEWADIAASSASGVIPNDAEDNARAPGIPLLATDTMRFHGEPIAVVVAEDATTAHKALSRIDVTYERRDAVTGPAADGPPVHDGAPDNVAFDHRMGDKSAAEAAIAAADEQFTTTVAQNRVIPAAIEPRGTVATYDDDSERLTLTFPSQNPHVVRRYLAPALDVEESRLRIRSPDIGGGFGSKLHPYPGPALTGWCAKRLGRPVKWVSPRSKDMQSTRHGRRQRMEATVGVESDGTIAGISLESHAPIGAYLVPGGSTVPGNVGRMLQGQYDIPAAHARIVGKYTTTAPLCSYRGAGHPEATYVIERVVREIARRLNLDPLTVRQRNFVPSEAFPYDTGREPTYDSGDYEKTLDCALDHVDYEAFRDRQERLRESGRYLGIGFSCYVMSAGNGPDKSETARVTVEDDGIVTVRTGTTEIGTGHPESYARLVGDHLEVSPERVDIVEGDTDAVSGGGGTGSSRSLAVAGSAIVEACEELLSTASSVAAEYLETEETAISYADGRFSAVGATPESVSLAELTAYAAESATSASPQEGALDATATYLPPNFTFPFGTHVAIVSVDPETGAVSVERYLAVDDVGPRRNPALVEGQIVGGVAQGLGQALQEEAVYDDDGSLLTDTLWDYAIPKATQLPEIETDFTETPSPHTPGGVKGAGEVGAVAAPAAIGNAVVDSLSPFGVENLDLPVTAEKVWRAIQQADRHDERDPV